MSLIVQKFGGSSVYSKEKIFNVAEIIKKFYLNKNKIVVVVSAQGNTTDNLLNLSKEINESASAREIDVLLSSGEQISMSLLSMALEKIGLKSISLTGWQAGIHTCNCHRNARIMNIFNDRIYKELNEDKIVVIAGFQGINDSEDITTMGRGGSDTSAVALAASLNASECQIYTDVNGIYTSDPRIVLDSKKIKEISYKNMITLSNMGAKVLNKRSVEMANKYNIKVSVLSSLKPDESGTRVCEVDFNANPITSVTINDQIFIFRFNKNDFLKVSSIIQNKKIPVLELFETNNDMILIISLENIQILKDNLNNNIEYEIDEDICQISMVGSNREHNFENFAKIKEILEKTEIKYSNMQEIISLVVKKADGKRVLNLVHKHLVLSDLEQSTRQ